MKGRILSRARYDIERRQQEVLRDIDIQPDISRINESRLEKLIPGIKISGISISPGATALKFHFSQAPIGISFQGIEPEARRTGFFRGAVEFLGRVLGEVAAIPLALFMPSAVPWTGPSAGKAFKTLTSGKWSLTVQYKGNPLIVPKFTPAEWIAGGVLDEFKFRRAARSGWKIENIGGSDFLLPDPQLLRYLLSIDQWVAFGVDGEDTLGSYHDLNDALILSGVIEAETPLSGRATLLHPGSFGRYISKSGGDINLAIMNALGDGWVLIKMITEGNDLFLLPPSSVVHKSELSLSDPFVGANTLKELREAGLISYRAARNDLSLNSKLIDSQPFHSNRKTDALPWDPVDMIAEQLNRWNVTEIKPVVDLNSQAHSWLNTYPELKDWLQEKLPYIEPMDIERLRYYFEAWEINPEVGALSGIVKPITGVLGEIGARKELVELYRQKTTDGDKILFLAPCIRCGKSSMERSDAVIATVDVENNAVSLNGVFEVITNEEGFDRTVQQMDKSVFKFLEDGITFISSDGGKYRTLSVADISGEEIIFYSDDAISKVTEATKPRMISQLDQSMIDRRANELATKRILNDLNVLTEALRYVVENEFGGDASGFLPVDDFAKARHIVNEDGTILSGTQLLDAYSLLAAARDGTVHKRRVDAIRAAGWQTGAIRLIRKELFGISSDPYDYLTNFETLKKGIRYVVATEFGNDPAKLALVENFSYNKKYIVDEDGTMLSGNQILDTYAHFAMLEEGKTFDTKTDALKHAGSYSRIIRLIQKELFGIKIAPYDYLKDIDKLKEGIRFIVKTEFDNDPMRLNATAKFAINRHLLDESGTELSGTQILDTYAYFMLIGEGKKPSSKRRALNDAGGRSQVIRMIQMEVFGIKAAPYDYLTDFDKLKKGIRFMVKTEFDNDPLKLSVSTEYCISDHALDEEGTRLSGGQILDTYANFAMLRDGKIFHNKTSAVKEAGDFAGVVRMIQKELFGIEVTGSDYLNDFEMLKKGIKHIVATEYGNDPSLLKASFNRTKHVLDQNGTKLLGSRILDAYLNFALVRDGKKTVNRRAAIKDAGSYSAVVGMIQKEMFGLAE